jgi:hypothetical protein
MQCNVETCDVYGSVGIAFCDHSFYFFNGKEALVILEGIIASILGLLAGLYFLAKKV